MKSGRPIDISKSSLVSLKAELIRKKEEADQLRGNDKFLKLPPKPVKQIKVNQGVSERDLKDREQLTEEEVDLLKKSREVLQIKSSLYDQLQSGQLVSEDGKSRYLVDFDRKSPEMIWKNDDEFERNFEKRSDSPKSALSEGELEIDESEWIEYTDCLGRTRRCHKTDLLAMRERDKELSKQVEKKQNPTPVVPEIEVDEDRQLVSNDGHLEELRRKWEEKERELLNKQDVHYEDLLFNEARSHGVGYWKFSTDEAKRREEQEMLRRIRSETEQRQKEARSLRERREQQRQARLIAARQRQRARLGLPPIDVSKLLEEIAPKEEEKPVEEPEVDETNEDLEVKLKKAAHVRPWDVGKDGLQQPLMTQEEWVEKKRAERPGEFAPYYQKERSKKRRRRSPSPSPPPLSEVSADDIGDIPLPDQPIPSPPEYSNPMMSQTKNFLKRRQKLNDLRKRGESEIYEPKLSTDDDSTASEDEEAAALRERKSVKTDTVKRRGAEIPPPMDFDYYTPSGRRQREKPENFTDTAAAIDAGLRILRDQVEKTQTAVPKGTYHIDSLK